MFWENGIDISQQVIEKIKNTYNERYDKICCVVLRGRMNNVFQLHI